MTPKSEASRLRKIWFKKGREQGIKEASQIPMRSHLNGDQIAFTGRCNHMDLRDQILSLLSPATPKGEE